MAIQQSPTDPHWNYFIALERDAETLSRYVDFSAINFRTHSIELARLLFSASAEVEVVGKLLCRMLNAAARPPSTFPACRRILAAEITGLPHSKVFVPRYGLTLTPLENLDRDQDPEWWVSYSRVKHNRDQDFHRATLHHALNSLSALLLLLMHLYMRKATPAMAWMETAEQLEPQPILFRPENTVYRGRVLR